MSDDPITIDSKAWTGEFGSPPGRLVPWRLKVGIGVCTLIAVFAPIAILSGLFKGAILIPLCRHGHCTVRIEQHGVFAFCVAVWLFLGAANALLAFAFQRLLQRGRTS